MADPSSSAPWTVPAASSSRKPPALRMPHSRNRAAASLPPDDDDDSGADSPIDSGLDSSVALILVHDDEDDSDNRNFDFSSDDEDERDDVMSPQFEIRKASIPPLPPSIVFLYLMAPYLKLGSMFLPYSGLSLKYGLSELLGFAVAAALARQIWYMLARYLRKADIEEVICDAFARGRGKERRRELLRTMVRAGTGTISVLLATAYLRQSVQAVLPMLPGSLVSPFSAPVLTLGLSLITLILSSSKSLASRPVVYATWLSIATYLGWLGCVAYAHSQGVLDSHSGWLELGTLWQGISVAAFAFTSSSTLPLYASLKGTTQPISTTKTPRSRSFRLLSLLAVLTSTLLMLPSILFAAFPNGPETASSDSSSSPSPTPLQSTPPPPITVAIAALNAATLLLGVPSILVTTPALPIPERIRRSANFDVSKTLIFLLVLALTLVPAKWTSVMSDVLLVLSLGSTFFLPALIHVSTHFFKRPLSIIIPPIPGTPAASRGHTPTNSNMPSPRAAYDELLQRKERALQKRQSRKRIVWDIGVWALMGISAAGLMGAVGRLLGRW